MSGMDLSVFKSRIRPLHLILECSTSSLAHSYSAANHCSHSFGFRVSESTVFHTSSTCWCHGDCLPLFVMFACHTRESYKKLITSATL